MRCHHFETVDALAPMAPAMASREPHHSMISRNEPSDCVCSVMDQTIGQTVLNCKANPSYDSILSLGHNVPMNAEDEKEAYNAAFIETTQALRESAGFTQEKIARTEKDDGMICFAIKTLA